jgi:hypothetical protein
LFIHVLLVLALVFLAIHLVSGRRTTTKHQHAEFYVNNPRWQDGRILRAGPFARSARPDSKRYGGHRLASYG